MVKRSEYERRVNYVDKVFEEYDKKLSDIDVWRRNADRKTADVESTLLGKLNEITLSQKEGVREMGKMNYGINDLNERLNLNTRDIHILGSTVYPRPQPVTQNIQPQYESIWDIEPNDKSQNNDTNRVRVRETDNEPAYVSRDNPSQNPGREIPPVPTENQRPTGESGAMSKAKQGSTNSNPQTTARATQPRPLPAPRARNLPPRDNNSRNIEPRRETMREKAARLTAEFRKGDHAQTEIAQNKPAPPPGTSQQGPVNTDTKRTGPVQNNRPQITLNMETVIEEVTICESNESNQNGTSNSNKSWVEELSDDEFASIVENVEEGNRESNGVMNANPANKAPVNNPKQDRVNMRSTSTPLEKGKQPVSGRNMPQARSAMYRPQNSTSGGPAGLKQAPQKGRYDNKQYNGTRADTSYASAAGKYDSQTPAPNKRKRVKSASRAIPLRSAKSIPLCELYVEGLAYSGCDTYEDIEQSIYQYCTERDIKLVHAKTITIRLNKAQVGCKIICNVNDSECMLAEDFWPEDIFARPWRPSNKSNTDENSDKDEL